MNTDSTYIAVTLCAVMLTAFGCDSNDRSESEQVDVTSAVAGEDYVAVSGTAAIAAGSRHTTLSVDVLGDDDGEADEALTMTLSNVSAAGAGLQINDTAAVEGDAGTTQMVFHVTVPAAAATDVTFDYTTSDGNPAGTTALSAIGVIENDEGFTQYTAAVVTAAVDFSSGAHSLIRNDAGTLTVLNDVAPTHSDLNIAAFGQNAFRIERFEGANVAKFDRDDDISSPEWQYSVKDPGDSAAQTNPRVLAFAHGSKAYLIRYEKNTAWIVNPAARSFAKFKLGELDLSAYADADGIVEMAAAVVGAGRLFIAMQRLDRDAFFAPLNTAYLAVFDIATDEEIDTGRDPNLMGIPLMVRNPSNDLVLMAAENALYVQGVGDFFGDSSGGIERIDLVDYSSQLIVDDDAPGATHGKTSAMAIVSPSKGYLVGYAGFGDNTLFAFNPSNGVITPPLSTRFSNVDIADISVGPEGNLWISDASNATVHLLDTVSDTVIDSVVTNLNPQQMAFFDAP